MAKAPVPLGWRWWAAVTSAAILLRALVALVLLRHMPLVSDGRDYFELAAQLVAGGTSDAFYWPPGQSMVLACAFALFGKSLVVARLLSVVVSVATVALCALLARELAGVRAARIAGWIAALYAPSILLCAQPYAQHLAALCLAALAYFGLRAVRERRLALFALAGAAMGLGCLTRPSMVSVAPVLVLGWYLALRSERSSLRSLVTGAALAASVALVLVVPVLARDARAGAGWTLSTNNERNLFLGNNPYTPDYKTSHLGQRSLDELPPDARAYLTSFYDRPDSRAAMRHEALAFMAQHPLRTAIRTVNRTTSFWGFDYVASREIQRWLGAGTRDVLALILAEAGSYLVVAVLALAGFFAFGRVGNPPWRRWLVALALAYEVPYALAFSGGTYHFPVVPLLVPFAALAASRPREAWSRVSASRGTILALAVLVIIEAQYAYYAARFA